MSECNKCSKIFANTLESIQHYCGVSPTDKPPREFWLVEMEGQLEVLYEPSVFANTQIHVVAVGALEALREQLAAAQGEIEGLRLKLSKWNQLEEYTGQTYLAIYGQAEKLKDGKWNPNARKLVQCDPNDPVNEKIHDELCDILEERGWNNDAVCTASTAIWAAIESCRKEFIR